MLDGKELPASLQLGLGESHRIKHAFTQSFSTRGRVEYNVNILIKV